jgi:hypothetical protein
MGGSLYSFMDYMGLCPTLVLGLLGCLPTIRSVPWQCVKSFIERRALPHVSPVCRKNRWSRALFLVVHDAVKGGESQPTFRRNISLLFSGSTSKPSKKLASNTQQPETSVDVHRTIRRHVPLKVATAVRTSDLSNDITACSRCWCYYC